MFLSNPFAQPFANPFPVPSFVQQSQKRELPPPKELELPRIVNFLADYSGCAAWRILWPEYIMNLRSMAVSSSITAMIFEPRWFTGVKAVKIQRQASNDQRRYAEFLSRLKGEMGFKLIYEVDDVVFRDLIPEYNAFKPAFDSDEIYNNCVDIINMCDEVTVTCDYMKKIYHERTGHQKITVIPNFAPDFWIGNYYNKRKIQQNYDNHRAKPRIIYAGSCAHYDVANKTQGKDDFSDIVQFVIDTRKKYQWIFIGAFPNPIKPYIESREIEYHGWQQLLDYPKLLSSLNAQAIIAPLEDNEFNRAKSNIKYIESCLLGIPCLVQDMVTYKDAPDFLKFKNLDEFKNKLEKILKDRKNYHANVEVFRQVGEQFLLERNENIGCHFEALTLPFGSPDRKFLSRFN